MVPKAYEKLYVTDKITNEKLILCIGCTVLRLLNCILIK